MKRILPALLAATVLAGIPAAAQTAISFTAAEGARMPPYQYFGEVAGVATNSKGGIFVFTRTGDPSVSLGASRTFQRGGTQLFQFDATGKYVKEIGKGVYGFLVAQQLRIDPQDNIWAVDAMSGMVIKFDPTGTNVVMTLGRKPEAIDVPQPPPRPPRAGMQPGQGPNQDLFDYPTDVALDAAGNIFVADGLGANTRIAKFNNVGKFVKSWGVKGTGEGQFADTHGVQVDGAGNVYVADSGNKRIQVFDNDGNFKSAIGNVGTPAAICISPARYSVSGSARVGLRFLRSVVSPLGLPIVE